MTALHLVLLYPPPWKISPPLEDPYPPPDGPSPDAAELLQDGDFLSTPYGLLTLAAEAERAGHRVTLLNLARTPWLELEALLSGLSADVFGLSCFTANRRGVGLSLSLLRRLHPSSLLLAGGPHASALPEALLAHWPALDAVVVGEGEQTLLEILARRAAGKGLSDIRGLVWREGSRILKGPSRPPVPRLDDLAPPRYPNPVLLTSRGCPHRCAFCGSAVTWGSKVRQHSVDYVLAQVKHRVQVHGLRRIAFKDDTFTSSRTRALEICQAFLQADLRFVWSCDTRVDRLDEGLALAMRQAGCERVSLGVESGDPQVLKGIGKGVRPRQVVEACQAARQAGLGIRCYLMLGNPGESWSSLQATLQLMAQAEPTELSVAFLAGYPGTPVFQQLEASGQVNPEVFFTSSVVTPLFYLGKPEDRDRLLEWYAQHRGLQAWRPYRLEERLAVLDRLPKHGPAWVDVAQSYLEAGQPVQAKAALDQAEALGYPLPGVMFHYRAVLAVLDGEYRTAEHWLVLAEAEEVPIVVRENRRALQAWLAASGPASGEPLSLTARHEFWLEPFTASFPAP